jgi:hypothetical protein
MDRRLFLQRFGMGVGAVILTPSIVKSALVLKENIVIAPEMGFKWNQNQIFIRVTNTNPDPVEIMLFGANKDITGNLVPAGVKIQVAGSNYHNLQMAILNNPMRIQGFKIKAQHIEQLMHHFDMFNVRPNGAFERRIFQPLNYRSDHIQDVGLIDAPGFELLLTPSVYIMTKIEPLEQVDYIFTVASSKRNFETIQYPHKL